MTNANQQLKDSARELRVLDKRSDQAASRALNRAIQQARTAANRDIRDGLKLKSSYLNQQLRIAKKANSNDLEAVLSTRKRGVLMTRYPHRELQSGGVSVNIRGVRVKMPGAFLMRFANGRTGIMVRVASAAGKSKNGEGRSKGLETLYSPSPSQAFSTVMPDVKTLAAARVIGEYERLMRLKAA
ncbi:Prophage minor tail protein Z (GPZ) [Marinospirillum celere]|uniref:Prophage minor tail protein Z (GPZ) n=1 Tax=Marinospirillum celere TaxID=1122252 RepID=A0A1I1E0L8_9GAMM|nr:phage tail protein [Marinospirillum celere]SFB80745.1 Prophage minor tail protein Z (GPZ) [Marinospirillum celere]